MTKTRMTEADINSLARMVAKRLRFESGTEALSAWSTALAGIGCLHEMDRTWPLVRDELDEAAFERFAA